MTRLFVRAGVAAAVIYALGSGMACARTKMTSMAAPEIHGHIFKRVLVIANIGDLGLRQEAENAFASAYRPTVPSLTVAQRQSALICDPICRYDDSTQARLYADSVRDRARFDDAYGGTSFVPAYTVLFPGRAYSQAEIDTILTAQRIEATLVITPTAVGTAETYVPPSYTTTCTSWSLNGGCGQTTTAEKGGVMIANPWAAFTAKVFDVRNGKVVWVSTSRTGGNRFTISSDLVKSMTQETLTHLRADNVVK